MGLEVRAGRTGPATGMSTFLQRQAKSVMDEYWQLIQVCWLYYMYILYIRTILVVQLFLGFFN